MDVVALIVGVCFLGLGIGGTVDKEGWDLGARVAAMVMGYGVAAVIVWAVFIW